MVGWALVGMLHSMKQGSYGKRNKKTGGKVSHFLKGKRLRIITGLNK